MAQYVRLIHWNGEKAEQRAKKLRAGGYTVKHTEFTPSEFRAWKNAPPLAVVIDLSRLPSQGRDLAMAIRSSKATRHIPIVFVDGPDDKVARTKKLLPDATYTAWGHIRGAVKRAIANPPTEPVATRSALDGYSGTPLPKKLGIKPDSVVVLVQAPPDFAERLEPLPDGTVFRRQSRGRRDLTIWFARSQADLDRRIDHFKAHIADGALWIAWPKKASNVNTDLTQTVVRKRGLAAGLVDYKICSIDETWSGLKFTRRKRLEVRG